MKNTLKKNTNSNNKSKKNKIKKCMEKFVENKIKYWTADINKKIKKLDNKKITNEEKNLLIELKKQRKETTNQLKKQYKLYNCNINCKNTLLEPGLPNQLAKSIREEYKDSKELLKMYEDQRKNIFKDKSNVLTDNFYEKTPNKIKKKLIKEGAISQCIPM